MEAGLIPYQALPYIECQCAIAFAPHPDDETFGCGGLLAALHANDIRTQAVIVTSGDFGEHGNSGADNRENETRSATEILGISDVIFWREPDRGVVLNERLVEKTMAAIISAKADLALTPSVHEVHPDHRACAWIVLEAARRLTLNAYSIRVAMYEVGVPLSRINTLVNITPHAATKDAAMACYRSQLAVQSYDKHIRSLNHYRTYTLAPNVTSAEAYCILDTDFFTSPHEISEAELLRQDRLGLSTTPVPPPFQSRSIANTSGRKKTFFNLLLRRN
jgi:LmbE family N-acetylglucosaminyl deacetylase